MKTFYLIVIFLVAGRLMAGATPLDRGTFTEIIRDVNTLSADGSQTAPAKVNDVLQAPERVRTGPESRAELTAPDQTITRVGANTVFSFEGKDRVLNLEQGNVLFHAPKGIGGGTIKSGGAAAAVLGTTLIVSANSGGGFKVILLEGRGKVTLANGTSATLRAGELVYVRPGGTRLSPVLVINLGRLVDGSQLIKGFSHELSSLPLIRAAINEQVAKISTGGWKDTGIAADAFFSPPMPGNGLNALDHGTYESAVPTPISGSVYFSLGSSGVSTKAPTPGSTGGRGLTPTSGGTAF